MPGEPACAKLCDGGTNGTDGAPAIPEILMIVCPVWKEANPSYRRKVKYLLRPLEKSDAANSPHCPWHPA